MCLCKFLFVLNLLWQKLQEKGFVFLCITSLCTLRFQREPYAFWQMSHENAFKPLWITLTCLFNTDLLAKVFPHAVQENDFLLEILVAEIIFVDLTDCWWPDLFFDWTEHFLCNFEVLLLGNLHPVPLAIFAVPDFPGPDAKSFALFIRTIGFNLLVCLNDWRFWRWLFVCNFEDLLVCDLHLILSMVLDCLLWSWNFFDVPASDGLSGFFLSWRLSWRFKGSIADWCSRACLRVIPALPLLAPGLVYGITLPFTVCNLLRSSLTFCELPAGVWAFVCLALNFLLAMLGLCSSRIRNVKEVWETFRIEFVWWDKNKLKNIYSCIEQECTTISQATTDKLRYCRVPARWGLQQTTRAPGSDKTRGQGSFGLFTGGGNLTPMWKPPTCGVKVIFP